MINTYFLIKKIYTKNKIISKKKIKLIIDNLINFIEKILSKNKKIKIKNFGFFNSYKKKIIKNNIFLKKNINIIYFKCSKKLINKINKI